jgi:hypothetical protein
LDLVVLCHCDVLLSDASNGALDIQPTFILRCYFY